APRTCAHWPGSSWNSSPANSGRSPRTQLRRWALNMHPIVRPARGPSIDVRQPEAAVAAACPLLIRVLVFLRQLVRDALVAVRAGSPHAAAVREMDGLLVLLVDRVAHLVAGGAEVERVGHFQGGVEAAPEDNAANEEHQGDGEHREPRARAVHGPPGAADQ